MKAFRNLSITLKPEQITDFVARIESALTAGWQRDRSAEAQGRSAASGESYYFTCSESGQRRAALVALVKRDQATLYVANVVPMQAGRLTYDNYNTVLVDFHDHIVAPVAKDLGAHVTLSNDVKTLDDWISRESAAKLRRFSAAANKSTGSSHPRDKERWYDFVVSAVRNDDPINSSELARWLTEEECWPDDIVHELEIEFEQEAGLLRYYRSR